MPLHLAHSDSPLATMLPSPGFIITLTLPCALMAVTTSAQMQRRLSQNRIQHCVHHRVHRAFCAFHVTSGRLWLLLSAFSLWVLASSNKLWTDFLQPRLPYHVLTTTSSTTCGILCWNCFSSSRLMVFSSRISWKSTWPGSHFLVTLLLIYYVTRRRCVLLYDDTLGTTAHGVLYVSVAPLPQWCHRVSFMFGTSL